MGSPKEEPREAFWLFWIPKNLSVWARAPTTQGKHLPKADFRGTALSLPSVTMVSHFPTGSQPCRGCA